MKRLLIGAGLTLSSVLLPTLPAHAGTVNYPLNLNTSLGNPVTDILILENDGSQVHASIYPAELPGRGPALISHDVSFTPVSTLVIGLTEGTDGNGNDKTQIIMLIDGNFAAANDGVQYSSVFPGAKHSLTIANLEAAVAGDATQLAWFTDTFFSGPAAGAAFASNGPFVVAEFTVLNIIGANAVSGNCEVDDFMGIPEMGPNPGIAQIGDTLDDLGPCDIEVQLSDSGGFRVEKTVTNNSGVPWTQFKVELGTGSGAGFVPASGQLFFPLQPVTETTGAFPQSERTANVITFTGFLPAGGTARFVFVVHASGQLLTLRQSAVGGSAAPVVGTGALLVLVAALGGVAALKLRRARAA